MMIGVRHKRLTLQQSTVSSAVVEGASLSLASTSLCQSDGWLSWHGLPASNIPWLSIYG